MTIHVSCFKCKKELDPFDLKPHKCEPEGKLVRELTVKELQELLVKAQKND